MTRQEIIEVMALGIAGYKGWGHMDGTSTQTTIRNGAAAAFNALEAAGYVVAPKEPTDAMAEAGWNEKWQPHDIWRAMLTASQKDVA